MKKLLCCLILCISVFSAVFAQSLKLEDAEPYQYEEFPEWAHQLRRSEIITVGSYPFTMMSVGFGYSLYRYFANDMSSSYSPNPFVNANSKNYTADEQKKMIKYAAGMSLGIGLLDFIINQSIRSEEKKQAKQKEEDWDPDIEIIPVKKTEVKGSDE
ncbi:MAG: hypothetical protein J5597_06625 [Spirochaetaceae bacterium]|nr:hypothetical protein [Spirochaetaceae bacterium]